MGILCWKRRFAATTASAATPVSNADGSGRRRECLRRHLYRSNLPIGSSPQLDLFIDTMKGRATIATFMSVKDAKEAHERDQLFGLWRIAYDP